MFNGRNILPDFPENFVKVINFLNEKESSGEFTFSDSFKEWEDNDDIIESLGLELEGENYYYAVSLAYLVCLNDGHLIFPSDINIWSWACSLQMLAEVADWDTEYMERVVRTFLGREDDINRLMEGVVQTFAKKDFDKGLILQGRLRELNINISAGLMENNIKRYRELFPPQENQEIFVKAYCLAYDLQKDVHEMAFDEAMMFESFNSAEAMAFLLKEYVVLEGEKKKICAEKIKLLLQSENTSIYVPVVNNWIFRGNDDEAFAEEIVLMLIDGLRIDNSELLIKIDNAVLLRHKNREFLAKVLAKVAESVSPMSILKMKRILHQLYKDRKFFSELVVSFIIHPKGEFRQVGREIWDEFHLETSEFKVNDLNEICQCAFALSMLQDFGNPETRLPKLLPLLKTRNAKVKKLVMGMLRPYIDDYMGHVVAGLDKLKINNKEAKIIKSYVDGRSNIINLRKETKELSPLYTQGRVFREARRIEAEYLKNTMKEADMKHHAYWKEYASTVILARSGGWRMADGTTQKLPLIQFSMPAHQMNESLSPIELNKWLQDILKNWDDTTGDN